MVHKRFESDQFPDKKTPLMLAAAVTLVEEVQLLIECKVRVNQVNADDDFALFVARRIQVRGLLLLEAGVNACMRSVSGETALMYAVCEGATASVGGAAGSRQ